MKKTLAVFLLLMAFASPVFAAHSTTTTAITIIVTMADERSIQWRQWADYDTRLAMTRNARYRDDPGRKRFARGCRRRRSGASCAGADY